MINPNLDIIISPSESNQISYKLHRNEKLLNLLLLTSVEWENRNPSLLNQRINDFLALSSYVADPSETNGFIEKLNFSPDARLAVIGDIHGNDGRLVTSFTVLKSRGYLDEDFHCLPNHFVIFLGDFVDRGENSLKVLELVMAFKMENMQQVFLIRGNHECIEMIRQPKNDKKYFDYLSDKDNCKSLNRFYHALPSVVYAGQQGKPGERIEYIQFVHALFYLYTDPAPLLNSPEKHALLTFGERKNFTDRIIKISLSDNEAEKKQKAAILKLMDFRKDKNIRFHDVYWCDVGETYAISPVTERIAIPPNIIKAYLKTISTPQAAVKTIIRGHQSGGLWRLEDNEKVLVTTLDPSSDDKAQVILDIRTAQKVHDYMIHSVRFYLQ